MNKDDKTVKCLNCNKDVKKQEAYICECGEVYMDSDQMNTHRTNIKHIDQCHHCLKLFPVGKLCPIESEKGQPNVCAGCYLIWQKLHNFKDHFHFKNEDDKK